MEAEDVRRKLDWALEAFLQEDRHLLENDLGERCIAARLAFYLQVDFEDECDRIRIHHFRDEIGYAFGALVECETRAGHEKTIGVLEWIPAS